MIVQCRSLTGAERCLPWEQIRHIPNDHLKLFLLGSELFL
jgi:hypothetical protein